MKNRLRWVFGLCLGLATLSACERGEPDRALVAKAEQPIRTQPITTQPLTAKPTTTQALEAQPSAQGAAGAGDVMGSPDPHVVLPSLQPPSPEASLYDLRLTLTDDTTRRSGFDVFRGSPVIVSMFYASCPHACPMLLSELKAVEAALSATARGKLRVLLVSLNPEKDTPKRLAGLKKRIGVDPVRWRFAQVPAEQVRELAAVLGIQYQKLPDGSFNHSSILTLLGPDGRPRGRIDGLGKSNAEMVKALEALSAAK